MQLTDNEWEFVAPYLSIGEYGPYPERLRQQFEGVIWRFKTGGQWRERPTELGAWSTVHNRFRQWRDPGIFEALLDSPQFIPVLKKIRVRGPVGRPRTRPGAVAGDKAYSSRGNRAHLHKRHIKAVIPEKKDQAANRKKKGSRGGRLPARLDDLDQRPPLDHPLITTRYAP